MQKEKKRVYICINLHNAGDEDLKINVYFYEIVDSIDVGIQLLKIQLSVSITCFDKYKINKINKPIFLRLV